MNAIIRMALENTVLCRGAHNPKESYDYAEKMERVIKEEMVKRLVEIRANPEKLEELIKELEA